MKSIVFMLLLSTSMLAAQSSKVKADKNAKIEEEIKKIEFELESLLMSGDEEKYGAYLADDYVLINSAGAVVSKDQLIAALKASTKASGDSLLPDNLNVRVYGETAVLNGHLVWKGMDGTQKRTFESLFTKVFTRKKGKWYMVSNQGTQLPQRGAAR